MEDKIVGVDAMEEAVRLISMAEIFVAAIAQRKIVAVEFHAKSGKGLLSRKCCPLDIGPSQRAKTKTTKFHFWDTENKHVISLDGNQIVRLSATDESFNPKEVVTWPAKWHIGRNW